MTNVHLTKCGACGRTTSRTYARKNAGRCKACVTGVAPAPRESAQDRHGRMLDSGWAGYAREEGYYDCGD